MKDNRHVFPIYEGYEDQGNEEDGGLGEAIHSKSTDTSLASTFLPKVENGDDYGFLVQQLVQAAGNEGLSTGKDGDDHLDYIVGG